MLFEQAFSVNWTAFAVLMVVIGGMGRIEGPIVGAVLFWGLNEAFGDDGSAYLLGLGLLAIVTTITLQGGLRGFAHRRWAWSVFKLGRRLRAAGPARADGSRSPLP